MSLKRGYIQVSGPGITSYRQPAKDKSGFVRGFLGGGQYLAYYLVLQLNKDGLAKGHLHLVTCEVKIAKQVHITEKYAK